MSKNTFGGINGFQVNKVGSVVGYKFRGEQVYRGYQKNVANPRTQLQVRRRGYFSSCSSLMRVFALVVNYGYRLASKGTRMSPRNMAMKANYAAISGAGEPYTVDYSKIELSKGSMLTPICGRLDFSTPNNVRIPIPSGVYDSYTRENLTLMCVVYCPSLNDMVVQQANYSNVVSGLSANVQVPAHWNGLEVHAWAFLGAFNGDVNDPTYGVIPAMSVSDSLYLGTGEVE